MTRSQVRVQTGSRLHFGLLSRNPELPRRFGGLGMMVEEPTCRVSIRFDHAEAIDASEPTRKRIRDWLANGREAGWITDRPLRVIVDEMPPDHAGFGSGTQLALAVGTAATSLSDVEMATEAIAMRFGRGTRSAIGIHGFEQGGFLVDAGPLTNDSGTDPQPGPLVIRHTVPETWRVLAVTPTDQSGLHGDDERNSFAKLPPMRQSTTGELCRLVLTELVPALITDDCAAFARSLRDYGQIVGEDFLLVQGGVFASVLGDAVDAVLRKAGHAGAVQTSWGPTVCAVCESDSEAVRLAGEIERQPFANSATVRVLRPRNVGREIITEA